MMPVLEFFFGDLFHFIGLCIVLCILHDTIIGAVRARRPK